MFITVASMTLNLLTVAVLLFIPYNVLKDLDTLVYYDFIGIACALLACGYSPSSKQPLEMATLRLIFNTAALVAQFIWVMYGN